MKYRYTAIFSIKGLCLPPDGSDRELVIDSEVGLRSVLTAQPNTYSFERDRGLVVARMMLHGFFGSKPKGEDFQQRVTNAVEELWSAREKKFGEAPYLVVVAEGEDPSFMPSHQEETDDFVFCLDGADKSQIRKDYETRITALINSLTSEAKSVIGVKKVADGVVFFREDGKPVYSYALSTGSATAYLSKQLLDEEVEAIEGPYRLLAADTEFQRVQRLLRFSLEVEQDTFRSFLAAWWAFEVFVGKAFRTTYECQLFTSLLKDGHPVAQKKYLDRIQNVMKDKYGLLGKFAVISFQLSPDTADDDYETVSHVKKIRDKLLHGKKVDETILPVKPIRDVAGKYLRLHLSSKRTAT